MKVSYEKVATESGFAEGILIVPETDFEKEWVKRHNFPKMYTGNPILEEKKE